LELVTIARGSGPVLNVKPWFSIRKPTYVGARTASATAKKAARTIAGKPVGAAALGASDGDSPSASAHRPTTHIAVNPDVATVKAG
jgi:hypothetical protein